MKLQKPINILTFVVLTVAIIRSVSAAVIEKADNATALNLAAAWTNGVVPGAGDIAQWDSTVTALNTTNLLGATLSWGGIKIINPGSSVNIQTGNTLTNGVAGIDMSSATVDLILSNTVFIAPGVMQQWNVANGRTLAVSAIPTKPGQPANNTGALQVGTTGTVRFGTAAATTIADNQGNPWVTYGQNDWAALDSSGNVIAATYTTASSAMTAGVFNDITGDIPGGAGSAIDVPGIRFNDATYHTLNIANSATARTFTCRGILMTPNCVGALIGGTAATSFIRPNRSTIANTSWNIIQNSTIGDLTISALLADASSSTPVHMVKSGPGNLIISNPTAGGQTGGIDINGGTLTTAAGATLGSGLVTVNNTGRLIINASNTTFVSRITVNGGATNSIKINFSGAQQFTYFVNFNGGTNHCEFNYAGGIAPSVTTAPLLVSNLTTSGAILMDIFNTSLAVGTYPLIKYTNSLTGSGFSAFKLGYMPPHILGLLSNDTVNSSIDLVVTNVNEPIKWAVGNANWDINATANWLDTLGSSTTYQQLGTPYSFIGDSVLFNDDASGSSPITVSVNTTVSPASTTVSNNVKNYTISGSGGIGSVGTFTKTGSGTLILSTSNSFSGGLNLNGGILNFSALTNLGSGGIFFNGGTLQYNGNSDDISVRSVTINSGGATIDTAGQNVNFTNAIGNGGLGGLTKIGSGTLTLNGTNRYAGNTVINVGTLALGSTNTYITNSPIIIVNSTLDSTSTGSGLLLAASVNQVLAGTGTVIGSVANPALTTISPATNGTIGTLTVGSLSVNGGNLFLDVATGSHDLINVSGNLSLNSGTITINTNAGPLASGTYKLIQYSGSLASGAGSSGNLTIVYSQPGKSAVLSDSTAGEIDLIIADSASDILTWSGTGANWDLVGTKDWLNGATSWAFTNGDTVAFNDSASGNSTVQLQATVSPIAVTVSNTSIATYTFADGTGSGGGKIGGAASLTKDGTGTLIVQTANTYTGPTTVKSGTLQIGNGGIGDIGSGAVTNNGALVFNQGDVNIHSVNGQISGSGSLTQQGSATVALAGNNTYTGSTVISAGTLQLGNGGVAGSVITPVITNNATLALNRSGSYSLTNGVTGTGRLVKNGTATASINAVLAYQGNTYISNGVVKLSANDQIPDANSVSGSTGWLVLDGGNSSAGTFDLNGFNEVVNALSGVGGIVNGVITNSGTVSTTTNTLTILGASATSFNGLIADNSTGSKLLLVVNTNSLQLNNVNTFSGGAVVGSGATLAIGIWDNVNHISASLGTGIITLNNGATVSMPTALSTAANFGNAINILPNATGIISSAALGNSYGGSVSGDASATNLITGSVSFGAASTEQYSNFLGTVVITNGGTLRFSSTSLSLNGGDNTTFEIDAGGGLQTRNQGSVHLGALQGSGTIYNPQANTGTGTWLIGYKNIDSAFAGAITATNAIVKVGTGTLTFVGGFATNIIDISGFGDYRTNVIATNLLSYVGATTISNGVLKLIVPNVLNTSPTITLASATAVLDATSMGFASNQYDSDGVTLTNQILITNSTFEVISGQTVAGAGTIRGNLKTDVGSTFNVGLPTGNLTVTNNAKLAGAVTMSIVTSNSPTCSELLAQSFTIDGTATLVVTNRGTNILNGTTFQLFNHAVNFTGGITLPVTDPTGTSTYVWNNNLNVDGSITLTSGGVNPVNATPTNIVFSVTGNTLNLSWPADHTGWRLQVQTNNLSTGLQTNSSAWFDVSNSTSINSTNFVINPNNGSVFYRLVYP